MNPPSTLTAAGKSAWRDAVAALTAQGREPAENTTALLRYARAVEDAARLRGEWRRQGFPVLAVGGATGSVEVPHPLVRMIQDAEHQAARHGELVGIAPPKGNAGRPRGATSAPDRTGAPPKVTRLRAVGA